MCFFRSACHLGLFIMRPYSDELNSLDVVEDLINQAMLDVDSAGK
jgi:hypothetical protein